MNYYNYTYWYYFRFNVIRGQIALEKDFAFASQWLFTTDRYRFKTTKSSRRNFVTAASAFALDDRFPLVAPEQNTWECAGEEQSLTGASVLSWLTYLNLPSSRALLSGIKECERVHRRDRVKKKRRHRR